MIDVALTWEEGEAREALYFAIANHMKKCYLNWNKDTVDDAVIFEHLKELSHNKINLVNRDEALSEIKDFNKKRKPSNNNNKGRNDQKKKNYKSN
jgi:hypothetical protein